MLVVFQRRIIYMGYSPIGARTETLTPQDSYRMDVSQISTQVTPKVHLNGLEITRKSSQHTAHSPILFYLQGNAGNPLSRLPVFERLLHAKSSVTGLKVISYAPSSYWTSSSRRPTQERLLEDYTAALKHTRDTYPHAPIIVYGHSLGGSIATLLMSNSANTEGVRGLILENAFGSIPAMIRAYFATPRVPYYHLHPLAFDKWDALRVAGDISIPTLVMVSESDELVPRSHGEAIHKAVTHSHLEVIGGALHENAYTKQRWSSVLNEFIMKSTEHK